MTSTDPLNLDAIEARANAATPGPWRDADTHLGRHGHTATVLSGTGNDTDLRAWLPSLSQEAWDETRNVWADAAYIAALNPAVALALVAEVRRLRTELAAARANALREAADEAEGATGLFSDSDEGAAAAGALEGLAIRFRRMAAAPAVVPAR